MRFKKSNCRKKMVFSQPDVPALGEVANFGTDYFLSKIKFLARNKRVFTTKFAILPNACACCTTQIYKYLHKNEIICKFIHARKEEFYPTIICIG